VVAVDNFSYGLLNPALAYAVSCLGAFLGLLCVARGRVYKAGQRALWLVLAAVSTGATGIWAMHFIAMLGYSIPGQEITYSLPLTIESMLLAILVVGVGLFIVGYGYDGWRRLLSGGTIIGLGVAGMHYMGMDGMSMPDTVQYNWLLVALSVVIAMVAGTAALWAGTRVRGVGATVQAAMIMGVAVTGMHYTGMAAMNVRSGSMTATSGLPPFSFVVPVVVGITVLTFGIAMAVWMARSEDEIAEDAVIQRQFDEIEARRLGLAAARLGQAQVGQVRPGQVASRRPR
jgi:NO-binding membrane sensor protein with MHYT domain